MSVSMTCETVYFGRTGVSALGFFSEQALVSASIKAGSVTRAITGLNKGGLGNGTASPPFSASYQRSDECHI